MKVLVTGGTGFIGTAIVETLARQNHTVVIYDIGACDAKGEDTESIKGDLFDLGQLTHALRECDAAIHMVGLPDVRIAEDHPQLSFDLNVRSVQTALEATRYSGISRLILASSAAIYGVVDCSPVTEEIAPKPAGIYAHHKYVAERLAAAYSESYGVPVTILRLFNVYGIRGTGIINIILDKALRGEQVQVFGEDQKRDFIHVSDVAKAFASVLTVDHGFMTYNVGTGIGTRIGDIVDLVKEYHPNMLLEYGDYSGALYDSVADISKIKRDTGFDPDTSDKKLREVIANWGTR